MAGFEARSFRGCGVVTSEPFEVSDDNESLQMLTRNSQIGEFYVMAPPQVKPKGDNGMHTCDIMIFDEERDAHVRIGWREALEATLCAQNAPFLAKHGSTKMAGGSDLTTWAAAANAWADYNDATSNDYDSLDKDVRIIVARPFIEHTMHNVIMCVAGRDTGATLFGPADMQLSANTQVKTIEGHYTGHFKAVVTKPQNVLVMRDVACAGYVAGCNTRWFAKGEDDKYSATNAADAIQARLSFANDDTDRYASMLAFPCMEGQFNSGQLDTVMSVTTRLLPWEVNNAGLHMSFPGGDDMYRIYNAELQLGQVHYGEDMKAAGSRRRLKPCALATPADRPPACVPLQRTRTSFPRDLPTYAQATQPTCPARCSLLTRALPLPVNRTQPAFLVPAAATTRSRARSCPSCRDRATSAPTPSPATRAGVAARACRSRRPATAWSRSSWRSTPRWPTRPVKRATRVPLPPPPNQNSTKHHHLLPPPCVEPTAATTPATTMTAAPSFRVFLGVRVRVCVCVRRKATKFIV